MTLEEITKRKAEIMAILDKYADMSKEEFEQTEFAKTKEYSKLFSEIKKLSEQENLLTTKN